MDWLQQWNLALDYLEEHLDKEIDLQPGLPVGTRTASLRCQERGCKAEILSANPLQICAQRRY